MYCTISLVTDMIKGEKTKKIYEIIEKTERPLSLKELRTLTNLNYNTIRGTVNRLVKQGLIKRVNKGVYGKT